MGKIWDKIGCGYLIYILWKLRPHRPRDEIRCNNKGILLFRLCIQTETIWSCLTVQGWKKKKKKGWFDFSVEHLSLNFFLMKTMYLYYPYVLYGHIAMLSLHSQCFFVSSFDAILRLPHSATEGPSICTAASCTLVCMQLFF